jgi:probable HAF family extracellular repeat protein
MTRFNLSLAILACSVATSSIAAPADVRYSLTPLDPSLTPSAQVRDLNDRGEVVGTDGKGDAFLWNGQLIDLGSRIDPTSPVSRATGINDRSDIVGNVIGGQGGSRNFLLSRGEVITIQVIGDRAVFPEAINNRRQVVGWAHDEQGQRHGFIWRRGEAELLEAPPGGSFPTAVAVNGRGVAVGTSAVGESVQSVLWKEGEARFIGPLSMSAIAINNREQVLLQPEFLPAVYSIWEDGATRPLPVLSGSLGTMLAFDMNNRGQVVGFSSMPDGSSRATLWHRDRAIDLNERIAVNDPLRPFVSLRGAFLINDRRQIVAFGPDSRVADGEFRFYLLTPVH